MDSHISIKAKEIEDISSSAGTASGGGSGCEAAAAAARSVLLLLHPLSARAPSVISRLYYGANVAR